MTKSKKVYCYIDETGQDDRSRIFVAVSVVSEGDQEALRTRLHAAEITSGVGKRKWRRQRHERQIAFLRAITHEQANVHVVAGLFQKPVGYFEAVAETIHAAIHSTISKKYHAIICIDGIDKKKASELTKILRAKGVHLEMVRGGRDESDPCLRLADRWAGCIREATEDKDAADAADIYKKAVRLGIVKIVIDEQ